MTSSFDFDRLIDRRLTGSHKWRKRETGDMIPMGVADMDFASPPAVLEILQRRVSHGVFGYTYPTDEVIDVVRRMLKTKYRWSVKRRWIVWLPGLVSGLNIACRSAGNVGDEVLTSTPVYPRFLSAPINMERKLVTIPLKHDGQSWTFDFQNLEAAITPRTRLFLLCNPHNPVGRVYEKQELETLAEICLKHDIWICSDEIHSDLVLDEDKHHLPVATIRPEFAERTITLMSPSKTFNLAGIGCGFAIIPNPKLNRAFMQAMEGIVPHVTPLSYSACLAAYRDSSDWHQSLIEYLRGNREIVTQAIGDTPGLSVSPVQATYLAWIDTHASGIEDPVGHFEDAGVYLWDGNDFGRPGFVRLNFGCSRSLLQEGLARIQQAMSD